MKEDPTVSLQDVQEGLIPDRRPFTIGEITTAKKFARKYECMYMCLHEYFLSLSASCN